MLLLRGGRRCSTCRWIPIDMGFHHVLHVLQICRVHRGGCIPCLAVLPWLHHTAMNVLRTGKAHTPVDIRFGMECMDRRLWGIIRETLGYHPNLVCSVCRGTCYHNSRMDADFLVFFALFFVCSGADTNEISGFVNHRRWRRNWRTESLLKEEEEEEEKEVE